MNINKKLIYIILIVILLSSGCIEVPEIIINTNNEDYEIIFQEDLNTVYKIHDLESNNTIYIYDGLRKGGIFVIEN